MAGENLMQGILAKISRGKILPRKEKVYTERRKKGESTLCIQFRVSHAHLRSLLFSRNHLYTFWLSAGSHFVSLGKGGDKREKRVLC